MEISTECRPVIEIDDVCKCYWVGQVPFRALNGVCLRVDAGEFVVLAGRSGSGKTTLLNIIAGLETADCGTVRICGKDLLVQSRDARALFRLRHVGFVFQAYNLIPVFSARENVAFVCQLQGISRQQCYEIADNWLREVGLADFADRRPDQLSGGEQQRVAIARALAMNPEIVLADEPTANLDTVTGRSLIDLMLRLNQSYQTTFVVASHDPDVIESASRLVPLADGCVLEGDLSSAPDLSDIDICEPEDVSLRHRLWFALKGRHLKDKGF